MVGTLPRALGRRVPRGQDLTLTVHHFGSGLPGVVLILWLPFLLGLSLYVELSNLFIFLCDVF